jgi:hypothetical protein
MDQLGGYRIVRRLGGGPRAELLLGRLDGESEAEASVALKHYRTEVDGASITLEIEALARAAGEHAVELLDVATAPSGSLALVLDRLSGGSLGRLLAQRPVLEPGELPTIIAPLGALVDRLHAAGVVHRGIRLESVLFDRAGAPVLACFGRANLIAPGLPPAAIEGVPGALADQRAVASIAATVLDRAADLPQARELVEWLASKAETGYRTGWGSELSVRALALAEAGPVDLTPAPLALEARIPARVPLDPAPPRGRPSAPTRGRRRTSPGHASRVVLNAADEPWHRGIPPDAESWHVTGAPGPARAKTGSRSAAKPALDAEGTPEWIAALIPGELLDRVRRSLAAVRARVWIAAALVTIALAAAIVVVPLNGAADAGGQPTGAPSPTATEPGRGWTPAGGSTPNDPVTGDDPVVALVALLIARERCIADRSVLCLDAVGQSGSAALAEDQQLIRSLQGGGETPEAFLVDADRVTLAERLGDTALLDLDGVADTQPASILLMKTDVGWRIRDYLDF